MDIRALVVPILAVALALLWFCTFWRIQAAIPTGKPLGADALTFVFSAVGALITSAAVYELGKTPDIAGLLQALSGNQSAVQTVVACVLLADWLVVGPWTIWLWLIGFAPNRRIQGDWEEGVTLLQNYAKSWLGFAVAAVLAYMRWHS